MAVLEFQGWAVLKLACVKTVSRPIELQGCDGCIFAHCWLSECNSSTHCNSTGRLFDGHRGDALQPKQEHGASRYVFVRAKVSTQFSCFAQPGSAESARTLRVASVFAAPDVLYEPRPRGGRVVRTGGLLLGNVLGLLITSAFGSPQQAIESLHCFVEGGAIASVDQPAITARLRINAGSGVIALPCRIELSETSTLACEGGGPGVRVVVSAVGCVRQLAAGPCVDVQSPAVEHELRCRRSRAERSNDISGSRRQCCFRVTCAADFFAQKEEGGLCGHCHAPLPRSPDPSWHWRHGERPGRRVQAEAPGC